MTSSCVAGQARHPNAADSSMCRQAANAVYLEVAPFGADPQAQQPLAEAPCRRACNCAFQRQTLLLAGTAAGETAAEARFAGS